MKTFAIINQKGGVGKTVTTIHLGGYLAKKNKVLLVDFDPQMNLSQGYKVPKDYPYDVFKFLKGDEGFRITKKEDNLFILSGSLLLDSKVYDRNILKERLNQLNNLLEDKFDYVLIDCQPSPLVEKRDAKNNLLPILNELALVAAQYIVVPLASDEFSITGLDNFIPGIIRIKNLYNKKLTISGVFFNNSNKTEKSYKEFRETLENSAVNDFLLENFVRKDVNIKNAVREGKNIFQLDPKSRAAFDFSRVCEEILKKIN